MRGQQLAMKFPNDGCDLIWLGNLARSALAISACLLAHAFLRIIRDAITRTRVSQCPAGETWTPQVAPKRNEANASGTMICTYVLVAPRDSKADDRFTGMRSLEVLAGYQPLYCRGEEQQRLRLGFTLKPLRRFALECR